MSRRRDSSIVRREIADVAIAFEVVLFEEEEEAPEDEAEEYDINYDNYELLFSDEDDNLLLDPDYLPPKSLQIPLDKLQVVTRSMLQINKDNCYYFYYNTFSTKCYLVLAFILNLLYYLYISFPSGDISLDNL